MLKPKDSPPEAENERPVGELVQQLIEDGKAYAKSEIAIAQAIATEKARALAIPAGLFAAAFVFALAAVTALAVGVVAALARFLGPLGAGAAGLLIFAATAAGLGWYGVQRLKRDL